MNLYVIGVNHRTAPLPVREKFSIPMEEYGKVLSGIGQLENVTECALLSTCNRTELHIFAEKELCGTSQIEERFCSLKGLALSEVKKHFFVYEGTNAIKHIIKVASGMDSMILGEDQILGQFRKAYEICMKQGASKAVLNTLSRLAVTSSKKIKTRNIETGKASSLAGQVAELLSRGGAAGRPLEGKSALVVGAGEVGRLVSAELIQCGVTGLYMTRRSCPASARNAGNPGAGPVGDRKERDEEKAEGKPEEKPEREEAGAGKPGAGKPEAGKPEAAGTGKTTGGLPSGVTMIDYRDRYAFIDRCDIIIGATSSPHYTITRDMLDRSVRDRAKERYFIDLAVPRDFDEAVGRFENTRLFNIDDLKQVTEIREKGSRQFDMQYIQEQINSHAEEFLLWFRRRKRFLCPEEA